MKQQLEAELAAAKKKNEILQKRIDELESINDISFQIGNDWRLRHDELQQQLERLKRDLDHERREKYTAQGIAAQERTEASSLREALRKLTAEISGMIGIEEPGFRQLLGNTNFQCIKTRWLEARNTLAAQEKRCGS